MIDQLRLLAVKAWRDSVGLGLFLGWVYVALFGCGLSTIDPLSVGQPASYNLERLWMWSCGTMSVTAVLLFGSMMRTGSKGPSACPRRPEPRPGQLAVAACACILAATVLIWIAWLERGLFSAIHPFAGMFAGTGMTLFICAWGLRLSRLDEASIEFVVPSAFAVSFLIYLVLLFVKQNSEIVVVITLSAVAMAVCSCLLAGPAGTCCEWSAGTRLNPDAGAWQALRDVLGPSAIAGVSWLQIAFFRVISTPPLAGDRFNHYLYPFLLACAVSVVLIFACIVVSRYMNITLAFRWSLPLFVLSYLPLMVDYDSQVLRMLGYALNFLGMFGVQYGCWLGIAKRAHRARTSIVPYMAALCAAEGAGVVAGCLIAFQVVHNPFTDILCVSFALLFVATATSMVGGFNPEWIFIRSPKNLRPAGRDDACAKAACSESPSCEAGQPPQARDEKVDDAPAELDRLFRQQALALQPRFALTDRETEVAGLLLAGRSRPYIRDTLFISLNTVGVHVRNIFSKCGVHSQQELIDLARQER